MGPLPNAIQGQCRRSASSTPATFVLYPELFIITLTCRYIGQLEQGSLVYNKHLTRIEDRVVRNRLLYNTRIPKNIHKKRILLVRKNILISICFWVTSKANVYVAA